MLVFLSIPVFCEVPATKHCNAPKKFQNFQTWNSRNTVMLKNFQKFQNSGIYGQAGGRFLKILQFF